MNRPRPDVVLTIAGSDPSGGAGVQADLAALVTHGTHGATVITALTVQDTTGVRSVNPVPAALVLQQARIVLEDLPVAAVKTGLLPTVEVVQVVADLAGEGLLPRLVVDPVFRASSGHELASLPVPAAYARLLLPHVAVLTPNGVEAGILLGREAVTTLAEARWAARELLGLGPRAVLVTGVGDGGDRVDVLADGDGIREFRSAEVPTGNDHGTGCTFTAALAARLARGEDLAGAVGGAKSYVHAALVMAAEWRLGRGRGPVGHPRCTCPAEEQFQP